MSSICMRILHENFHINGFALSLALKLRLRAIRKWPGQMVYHQSYFNSYVEPFRFYPWTWSWFLYLFVCIFFPCKPRSQVWINHIETGFWSKKSANLKNVHPNGLFWSIIFPALQLLKRQKKSNNKEASVYRFLSTQLKIYCKNSLPTLKSSLLFPVAAVRYPGVFLPRAHDTAKRQSCWSYHVLTAWTGKKKGNSRVVIREQEFNWSNVVELTTFRRRQIAIAPPSSEVRSIDVWVGGQDSICHLIFTLGINNPVLPYVCKTGHFLITTVCIERHSDKFKVVYAHHTRHGYSNEQIGSRSEYWRLK